MLDGKMMSKEYYDRMKGHIDEVWESVCDNIAGDCTFAANLILSINARFFNVLVNAEVGTEDVDRKKRDMLTRVRKEFLALVARKLDHHISPEA